MVAALRTLAQLWGAIGVANDVANFANNDPLTQAERLICDIHATNPQALSLNPEINRQRGARCRPYYDELGVPEPAPSPPPFTGGQCEVPYDMTYERRIRRSDCSSYFPWGSPTTVGPFDGPVSGVSVRSTDLGNGTIRDEVVVNDANGETVVAQSSRDDTCELTLQIRNISFARRDGQPDTCGDPPEGPLAPVPNYPRPPTENPGGTYTPHPDTGGDTINIETKIDVDGDEYYEISGPTFNYSRAPGFGEPNLPEDPVEPATEGDPVEPTGDSGDIDDDISPEDEQSGLETVGYRWRFPSIPLSKGGIPNTDPRRFYAIFGSVQLKISSEGGLQLWTHETKISASEGAVFRPDPSLKVEGLSFNKLPDYGPVVFTPIRVRRQENAG